MKLIAAVSQNGVIGRTEPDGKQIIPWHLPDDLKRFKALTLDSWIIMGRKTYESIGKPLPRRVNCVLTTQQIEIEGVNVYNLPDAVLGQYAEEFFKGVIQEADGSVIVNTISPIFVIGGRSIYDLYLPDCDYLYITLVRADIEGDVLFPELKMSDWEITEKIHHVADLKHQYAFDYITYKRRDQC